MNIPVVIERARGCGFRKPGGMYLRLDEQGEICGMLPIPLNVCPCCGLGIKPSRGFTWINLAQISEGQKCARQFGCGSCPLNGPLNGRPLDANFPELGGGAKIHKAGLLWIGEQFYKTPDAWLREAQAMGISRRITTIPHGFKVGETWIALAHRKAIISFETNPVGPVESAGIFHIFRPDRIEYVIRGDETEAQLTALVNRGLKLIKVERAGQPDLI